MKLAEIPKKVFLRILSKIHRCREAYYASRMYRSMVQVPKFARLRKKEKISVLFIVCAHSMWKADSLYKAMRASSRFEVEILLVPNVSFKNEELRAQELQNTRRFFDAAGYHYVEWCDANGNTPYKKIPPQYDLLFYPQPWAGLLPQPLDFPNNLGRLMVCCEYAFHSGNQKWAYNKWYQNAAILDIYENEATHRLSLQQKSNKGVNSVVCGLPIMDEFHRSSYASPWKQCDQPCKKIIWAPHWSIDEKSCALPPYSNFLEMADMMLNLAKSTQGQLQFAFKPHPFLIRELYKHPDWGKEKTDRYYAEWEHGANTQLELGAYVELFMTSDAMVHDSSSFCCEYMLTGNPVLFMARNAERQTSCLNEMALAGFSAQYMGHSLEDVSRFISEQVLQQNDFKKEIRAEFVNKYLSVPNNASAAQNIIAAILGEN